MKVAKNISLKAHNTFGLNVNAKQFIDVTSKNELIEVLTQYHNKKKFVLGGGSNILLTKDIDALVIHMNNKGIEIIRKEDDYVFLKVQAGENWHELVLWCLDNDLGGLENLSLIPGNVGTAPIQNIGAYGVELKDVFVECEAICIENANVRVFTHEECHFGYRNSVFKNELKGKYVISNVTFKLTRNNHKLNTAYGAIQSELDSHNIKNPTIKDISRAVIKIRESKLPDPKKIGNSGSFFKNPIVNTKHFESIKDNFPEIPHYIVSNSEVKIPAGWLIEKAGFKGKRFGNYGVHKKQALVLVNYGKAEGKDILELSKLIQSTIYRLFNIHLEAEVNII